ncbi:hypothetical protein B5V48_24045 [Salmonella enterica]|nr:hypothetical protein [Salmonella enterica]
MRNRYIITFLPLLFCFSNMNVYAQSDAGETNISIKKQKESADSLHEVTIQNLQDIQSEQDSQRKSGTIPKKHDDITKPKEGLAGQITVSADQQNEKNKRDIDTISYDGEHKSLAAAEEEIEKLKQSQNNLRNKIDKLTKAMYLSSSNFGEKNGPGYYYRFTAQQNVNKTFNDFFYIIKPSEKKEKGKRKEKLSDFNKSPQIQMNDFVTFELKEALPDTTIVSQTPLLTVLNDEHLPDIVRAAFSVGKPGETIIIVALAKQVYSDSDKDNLPKGISPDTTLIYQFKLVDSRNADSKDFSVLRTKN